MKDKKIIIGFVGKAKDLKLENLMVKTILKEKKNGGN